MIDQDVDVVVPALVESLNDPFMPIRVDAALALGKIGPRARDAVPALIAARDYTPKPRPNASRPRRARRTLLYSRKCRKRSSIPKSEMRRSKHCQRSDATSRPDA